jgi:ethylmalonyl-CoA/methylmalonyl-CoA decarboxylase
MAMNELMNDAVTRFSQLPLISMAIVTGGAIGGGSELVTGFDFICMSEESGFIHFVQTRMGVSSPWGGMRRLVDILGKKKALRWMAGGFRINAQQGYEEGFVDVVVEKDVDCLSKATAFLQPFLTDERTQQRVSPNAVRGMKKLSIKKNSNWEYESKIFESTVFGNKVFSKL